MFNRYNNNTTTTGILNNHSSEVSIPPSTTPTNLYNNNNGGQSQNFNHFPLPLHPHSHSSNNNIHVQQQNTNLNHFQISRGISNSFSIFKQDCQANSNSNNSFQQSHHQLQQSQNQHIILKTSGSIDTSDPIIIDSPYQQSNSYHHQTISNNNNNNNNNANNNQFINSNHQNTITPFAHENLFMNKQLNHHQQHQSSPSSPLTNTSNSEFVRDTYYSRNTNSSEEHHPSQQQPPLPDQASTLTMATPMYLPRSQYNPIETPQQRPIGNINQWSTTNQRMGYYQPPSPQQTTSPRSSPIPTTTTTTTNTANINNQSDTFQYEGGSSSPSTSTQDLLSMSSDKMPNLFNQQIGFYQQNNSTPTYYGIDGGSLTIDLYHKPRGSKGTWMPISANDQIRVTEGKGKRLKMIVHSEQELIKIGLQVALLDSQNLNGTPTRRNSSSTNNQNNQNNTQNNSNPPSPSNQNSQNNNNQNNNNTNNTTAATAPSPSVTSSNVSSSQSASPQTMLPNALSQLNSSTNSSPSTFSLSSPAQSPLQTSSNRVNSNNNNQNNNQNNNNQYSVSISVTPPSHTPQPLLPTTMSTQLPPPDPLGLSVESVRVFRYPSTPTNPNPISALEFELKLAKLSKRLCLMLLAQTKDGITFDGKSIEFFAHNNGKHNSIPGSSKQNINNARKSTAPYQSPTIQNQSDSPSNAIANSPGEKKKKKSSSSSGGGGATGRSPSTPMVKREHSSNNMLPNQPLIPNTNLNNHNINHNLNNHNNNHQHLNNPPLPPIPFATNQPLEYPTPPQHAPWHTYHHAEGYQVPHPIWDPSQYHMYPHYIEEQKH